MLNRITIMGRLVANPELRYTPKGTPVCSIRIACDRETKNADGEYDTDFIDVDSVAQCCREYRAALCQGPYGHR